MTMPVIAERHPNDELVRVERLPHIWCPGCGLGEVVGAFTKAVKNLEDIIPIQKHVVVSGIGCTGRTAGYVKLDSYHTTHGRPVAFATGMKLANKDLEVTVISGDGDLSTIGGNHIIHAARRNININVIMVNNFIYGMTGGQMSATTPHKAISSTSQKGNFEYPFNMPALMKGAGATHVARWTALHLKQLEASIEKAFNHDGFSFIEVISPCPKGFGRKNKFREPIDTMRYFEEMAFKEDTIDLSTADIPMHADVNLAVGEFVLDTKESYNTVKADFLKRGEW
jgi:2-oxoglutarate ferredoxin oxidoreductase subunit beta